MSNLENLKRMRDILTRMGYDDVEKQELLEAFYREDIVQAALKDNIMNTHNENDIHRHCQRIEYEDEEEFLKCNRRYYQTRGVTLIPLKGKSSIPPAPIIPPSSPPPPPVIEEPEKSES